MSNIPGQKFSVIAMLTPRHLPKVPDVIEVSTGSTPGGAVRAGHATVGTAGYQTHDRKYIMIHSVKILRKEAAWRYSLKDQGHAAHTSTEVDIAPVCS